MDSKEVLFKLIRMALGSEKDFSLPNDVDWREVYRLASEQGVAAIAMDGVNAMCEQSNQIQEVGSMMHVSAMNLLNSPELEGLKYEWLGQCVAMEDTYYKYKSAIGDFVKWCNDKRVKVLLLKGLGLSINYPIAIHRPCGDIDVYLYGLAEFINKMVEKQFNVLVVRENVHHSVFQYHGFTIENHITLMDVERHKNHLSDEKIFQDLIAEGCDELEINGTKCFVPSAKLNSVYLLRHMAHHFAVERVSLRHLLDWALFVKAKSDVIDWEFVWNYVMNSGCEKFLNCLNGICVESLGFDVSMFPIKNHNLKLQTRMLEDILNPEFDCEIPAMSQKLKYGIAKTFRILANRWKYKMVSKENLSATIWNLAKNRIRN